QHPPGAGAAHRLPQVLRGPDAVRDRGGDRDQPDARVAPTRPQPGDARAARIGVIGVTEQSSAGRGEVAPAQGSPDAPQWLNGLGAPNLMLRRVDGDERILEVAGEIDVATSPALRSELSDLLGDAPPRVTLDFAQVSFIDSSGLGVLVGALKRL